MVSVSVSHTLQKILRRFPLSSLSLVSFLLGSFLTVISETSVLQLNVFSRWPFSNCFNLTFIFLKTKYTINLKQIIFTWDMIYITHSITYLFSASWLSVPSHNTPPFFILTVHHYLKSETKLIMLSLSRLSSVRSYSNPQVLGLFTIVTHTNVWFGTIH